MKEAFKHFTYNIFKRSNETPDKRKKFYYLTIDKFATQYVIFEFGS